MPVHGAQYSRNGHLLMTCAADGSILIWSVADMEVVLKLVGHRNAAVNMCIVGNSDVLATVSEGGELAFWNLQIAQDLASSVHLRHGTSLT